LKVLRTVAEVTSLRGDAKVALVPTMGAFHEGHLSLMRHARSLANSVWVSLFVNPTQFGPSEDFAAYPRDESRDLSLAESAGVDVVWAPPVSEVYTDDVVPVKAGAEAQLWEGEHRPGHFDGVATVVKRLFDVVRPDVAVFGLKDLQQCAVIRALNAPVKLEFMETVREPSGLAMSSRNQYFTPEQKEHVSVLFRALTDCALSIRDGGAVEAAVARAVSRLSDEGFAVDYVACVDAATMQPAFAFAPGLRVIAAAKIYGVRLIDNVAV
jgi:pantoate--beta-alanine ligase